jgi:hypothetical protein
LNELVPSRIKERVENRNMSAKNEIILEDTNTSNNETNAIRENTKDTKNVSNKVNKQKTPYKDALIRSNFS